MGIGVLGKVEIIPFFKDDSGGLYLTTGFPGEIDASQVATQLRKFADHIERCDKEMT